MGGLHPLLVWLDRAVSAAAGDRTLVCCNSAMGAAALRRALTAHRGALLGVDFVTPAGLARRLLAQGGVPCSDDVPDPLEERTALGSLAVEHGASGRYARRFAPALDHLLRTVKEVQTLGPVRRAEEPSAAAQEVLALTDGFENAFDGRGGRTRWIAQAILAAAEGALQPLPARVVLAGEADPGRDLRLLLQLLSDQGVQVIEWPLPDTATPSELHVFSAPHPAAELRLAARRCLAAARRGVAWHDMVVAAPRLRGYAPHLEEAFSQEGVPFHTAVEASLLHHARAALCLHLARILFERAPRPSFMAVVASHLLRRPVPPREQATVEIESRIRALGGTGPDTAEFVDELDRKHRCRTAARLLRQLLRQCARAARTRDNAARAALLREVMAEVLAPAGDADQDAAERIDDCLRALVFDDAGDATTVDATTNEAGARTAALLEDLLRERTVPLRGRTRGGVAIVTYGEALAHPCRTLHLLGLSRDLVPGPAPLATFLDDRDRAALALPTADLTRAAEERRLRALLHHAGDLTLSYPRADATGMPQELTLWADRLHQELDLPAEVREPGHPESRAQRAVASGCCPPDLARDHLALGGCREPAAFAPLVGADPSRVLARTRALESFEPARLDRDGDIGAGHGDRQLRRAVPTTQLERLGRCPQQFLFGRVLGIKPLPAEPDPLSLPRDRMGTAIHAVVERLYRARLADLQDTADPAALADAMCAQASELLDEELKRDTSILRREFPGLHDLLRRRWTDGLHHAIRADLALMQADGSRPAAVELALQAKLPVRRPGAETGVELHVKGTLDRVDALPGEHARILDFKTGARPQKVVDPAAIFRGTNLQLVLYAMMLRAREGRTPVELEVRALRPRSGDDLAPFRLELPHAHDYVAGSAADGVRETLHILGRVLQRGLLLPSPGRHCSWCDFKAACRRHHPPSRARVEGCEEAAAVDFGRLQGKSTRAPLLDEPAREPSGT